MTPQEEQRRKNTLTGTAFNSLFMQPKVLLKGSITATTTPTVIPHGQTSAPHVRIWARQLTGENTVPVLVSGYTGYHSRYTTSPNALFYVDDTNLTIYTDVGSCTVYYRIYQI